jgi:hypothetical protein
MFFFTPPTGFCQLFPTAMLANGSAQKIRHLTPLLLGKRCGAGCSSLLAAQTTECHGSRMLTALKRWFEDWLNNRLSRYLVHNGLGGLMHS